MTDQRIEITTARDKLAAGAGFLTHALNDRCDIDEAIAAADRLLDVVAGHLAAAKASPPTEEEHGHGG